MTWHLGDRPLGDEPTAIIAVRDAVSSEDLRAALDGGAHAIEFRIDQFVSQDPDSVVRAISERRLGPSLATIRHAREGGAWNAPESTRLALYSAVLPIVDGVDCELSATEIVADVFREASAQGKLTIGSFHDFNACPGNDCLEAIVEQGNALHADIVKVAAMCPTMAELRRLAAFTLRHADRGIIVIGMGPAGTATRVFFPALGSLMTYTFLGEPAAPGQLNCPSLVEYLSVFYN